MGLREVAEADLEFMLEVDSDGFAWPISLTDPAGTTVSMQGFSNDVAQVVDPDTGQVFSGRTASIALRIASIYAALPGSGLPESIEDASSKPWVVAFDDIHGLAYTFKVEQSNPDRTLGVVTCVLEQYE